MLQARDVESITWMLHAVVYILVMLYLLFLKLMFSCVITKGLRNDLIVGGKYLGDADVYSS